MFSAKRIPPTPTDHHPHSLLAPPAPHPHSKPQTSSRAPHPSLLPGSWESATKPRSRSGPPRTPGSFCSGAERFRARTCDPGADRRPPPEKGRVRPGLPGVSGLFLVPYVRGLVRKFDKNN